MQVQRAESPISAMPNCARFSSLTITLAASALLSTQKLVRAAALQCAPVGRPRMDAVEKAHELRPARVQACPRRGRLQGKAHLDIGRAELAACEPCALAQLR